MNDREAATRILESIAAPAGTVSVSVWYDRPRPYIKVYVAAEVSDRMVTIPQDFAGYPVVVEAMPEFRML